MAATEPVYVLDACAVIALLYGEEGSEEVMALLEEPENRCRIHALNLCEVFYDGLRRGNLSDAARVEGLVAKSGIEIAYASIFPSMTIVKILCVQVAIGLLGPTPG